MFWPRKPEFAGEDAALEDDSTEAVESRSAPLLPASGGRNVVVTRERGD